MAFLKQRAPVEMAGVAPPAHKAGGEKFNAAAHGLRGIAAMMVFCAHLIGGPADHIYADNPAYVRFVEPFWAFGVWGVLLFFMISGFVILPSAIHYAPKEFFLRRGVRLYPLFLVCTLVFVALNHFTNEYPMLNTPKAIVSGLLFLNLFTGTDQLTPNAWSLTYEVIFYCLACMTAYFYLRHDSRLGRFVSVALCLTFFAFFPRSIYFAIGCVVRVAYDRGWLTRRRFADVLEGALLIACVYFSSRGHFEYKWADFANPVVPATIFVSAGYFLLAVRDGSLTGRVLGNGVCKYLGTVSYSLYLIHPYVYYASRLAFKKAGMFTADTVTSIGIFMIVTIPIGIAVTHVVHIVLERWPYQWFFGQRIYRTKHEERPADETARPLVPAEKAV